MSKETRTEIREYLANWTLPQIEAAFRAADIPFTAAYRPPVIGTRRVMVERYYRSLDFTKPADAEKFVRLCDEVVRGIDRRLQSEVSQVDHHRTAREQIVHWLRRDGFTHDNGRFVAVGGFEKVLAEFQPDALARAVARIERGIDADPRAAVEAAKRLVETCCSAILAARGKPVTDGRGKRINALVRRVAVELDLLPNGSPESSGAVSSLLDSLVKVFQSATDRHNRAGVSKLTASHAKLAVGAAATLTAYLFEAYQSQAAE
jgi:hypothetical protein